MANPVESVKAHPEQYQSPASSSPAGGKESVFRTLRRFNRARLAQKRCELCDIGLQEDHRHLLEISKGRIVCACDACALRFQAVDEGRFKLIPRSIRSLPELDFNDSVWDSLALPINLAFFFRSSAEGKIKAVYPSPAGATESLLPLNGWDTLVAQSPVLAGMEPDVEALLADRVGEKRQYYLAPIDVCFELVGLIRMHWRGLAGGEVVWSEIDRFFARLRAESRSV
ncbi:MAG TPA: DUF5947 family protein [Chthoniobacterales bacterium]|nr:DUF5947 family protein [Chthoniobacterales bacterium]